MVTEPRKGQKTPAPRSACVLSGHGAQYVGQVTSKPEPRTTAASSSLPPVPQLPAEVLAALRAVLTESSFTAAGLRALWGSDIDAALSRNNAAPAIWFTSQDGATAPLATLARLFVLHQPVTRHAAEEAFGTDLLGELRTAGLLQPAQPEYSDQPDQPEPAAGGSGGSRRSAGSLTSALALTPYPVPAGVPAEQHHSDTVWLFSDHGTLTEPQALAGDFVLGVGGAGRTLAEITPRHRVRTALDLGTGCGIQAVLLGRHADTVIATDISPRALELTRLNAGLNGLENIETRLGSLFEPVQSETGPETFDLIVSNPPFVITPQGQTRTLEYRDGGKTGDTIMREILRRLPDHLTPDGHAALLGNWESTAAAHPAAPTDWVTDAHTHVSIIQRDTLDPVAYAETWIRDGGVPRASAAFNRDTAAWLSDFAARGVTEIGFGWVRMRKTAEVPAAPVRDFATLTGPLGANPDGIASYLDMRLGLLEWLAEASDDELLTTVFVRAEGLVEHRHFTPGADSPTAITLEQGTGFARELTIDPALAGFIGVADGSLTLGVIAGALAQLLDVDPEGLKAQLLEQVRELVPAGIVFPHAGD